MSEIEGQPIRDTRRETPAGPGAWRQFSRAIRNRMPTGLYARSLLIIILPMIILQTVVSALFMERHWRMVSERLSVGVSRDIDATIAMIEGADNDEEIQQAIEIVRRTLGLNVLIDPGDKLPELRSRRLVPFLDQILITEIERQIDRPFWIDTVSKSPFIEVRVISRGKTLRIFVRQNETYASNTHIFIFWMIGASLVLIAIAVLFLRGQIRPILALARAAESFGKGQRLPEGYSPRGADEVRRAGLAFILMRERIERQMEQRTAMLAGVSHDLRTILTRFKLQLALSADNPDLKGLNEDVEDMQNMLEGYMAFARGETGEDVGALHLGDYFEKAEASAALADKTLSFEIEGDPEISVRPGAFTRLLNNLVSNALRYSSRVTVTVTHSGKWLTIVFDDNGPGIPADARDDVFKPFFRLDDARNLDASGTGLGLAIARDIARSHGGNVTLADSPLGGLRATIRVPV